jgi:hypothetical protein
MRMNMFATKDKAKPDIENIGGLNLAVIKSKTAEVTKLWLDMICFAKPGLTDFHLMHKEESSITCYMYDTYT